MKKTIKLLCIITLVTVIIPFIASCSRHGEFLIGRWETQDGRHSLEFFENGRGVFNENDNFTWRASKEFEWDGQAIIWNGQTLTGNVYATDVSTRFRDRSFTSRIGNTTFRASAGEALNQTIIILDPTTIRISWAPVMGFGVMDLKRVE